MKIRGGFVSNSSSSSYMISYEDENLLKNSSEIIDYLQNNVEGNLLIIGRELSDGRDVFRSTPKIREWLLNNRDRVVYNANMIGIIDPKVVWNEKTCSSSPLDELPGHFYEYESYKIDEDIKKNSNIIFLNVDYASVKDDDIEALERRYW